MPERILLEMVEAYKSMVFKIFEMQSETEGFLHSALGRRNTERMVREIMGGGAIDDNASGVPVISSHGFEEVKP